VQQLEDSERAAGGDQVQIGHAASEQRMSLAEVVVNVQPGPDPDEPPARLVHGRQLRHQIDQGLDALVLALERPQSHRVLEDAGHDRMALILVGVQEAFRGGPVDHLRELPSQIHRVLHADAEALSTRRVVHVRRVARQQHSSVAVGRGLPSRVGEPGDPGGVVDPEVRAVHGDERVA
jgi:hypothetical protein